MTSCVRKRTIIDLDKDGNLKERYQANLHIVDKHILKFYLGVSGQFRTTKYNESIKKEIDLRPIIQATVEKHRYQNYISCISQIEEFPQTQENAVFEYAEKHKSECFDPLADHVELLDFPKMVLSDWKVEKGKITLRGWFSATLKLQQGDAEAIENGTGSITTEDKGFDFSITLGDDFKIVKDKETQKEIIEIKLQGT